jgi:hypothetical protein
MPNPGGTVGAHSPVRPQEFFTPPPSPPPFIALDDGSDSWWSGVAQCAVGIAIAATLALSVNPNVAPHQDEIVPKFDDDSFQVIVTQSVSVSYPQQWTFDTDFTVPAYDSGDAWNIPPPWTSTFGQLYLVDPEEIPAGLLFGPEEDVWFPQILAQAWNLPQQAFTDDDVLPAGAAPVFSMEEDYWWKAGMCIPVIVSDSQFVRVFMDTDDALPIPPNIYIVT